MANTKEEYIVYFHIQRDDGFLLTNKTFGPLDSNNLRIFDSVDVASKHVEDKDTDKIVHTLWFVGSKELSDWLKKCSQK